MRNRSFADVSDHYRPDAAEPDGPTWWELAGRGTAAAQCAAEPQEALLPPSFRVRLTFSDGADVDVLAVVSHGRIAVQDLHARPPLSSDDFAALVHWIERPLADGAPPGADAHMAEAGGAQPSGTRPPGVPVRPDETPAAHRARPAWPRGSAGRRFVAEAYRAAQREGRDPVLAVMCATGHSRRKSLRLIAGARDAGFLAPRHNRR